MLKFNVSSPGVSNLSIARRYCFS